MNFAVTGMTTAPQQPAGWPGATADTTTGFAVAMDVALSATQPSAAMTTTGTAARGESTTPVLTDASRLFATGALNAFSPSPNMAGSVATFLPAIVSMAGLAGYPNAGPTTGAYGALAGLDAKALGPLAATVATVTSPSLPTMPSDTGGDTPIDASAITVNRPLPSTAASDMVLRPTAKGSTGASAPSLLAVMPSPTAERPTATSVATIAQSLLVAPTSDVTPANRVTAAEIAIVAPATPVADAVAIRPSPKTAGATITTPALATTTPGEPAADITTMRALSQTLSGDTAAAESSASPPPSDQDANLTAAPSLTPPMVPPDQAYPAAPLAGMPVAPRSQTSNVPAREMVERPMVDGSAAAVPSSTRGAASEPLDPQPVLDRAAIPASPTVESPATSVRPVLDHVAEATDPASAIAESGASTAQTTGEARTLAPGLRPALAASPSSAERESVAATPNDPTPTVDAANARSNAPSTIDGPAGLAMSMPPIPNPAATAASPPTAVSEGTSPAEAPSQIASARADLDGSALPPATDGATPLVPAGDDQSHSTMSRPRTVSADRTASSRRASAGKSPVLPPDERPATPAALPSVLAVQLLSGSSDLSTRSGGGDRAPAEAMTATPAIADKSVDADLAPSPVEPAAPPQPLSAATIALAAPQTTPLGGTTANVPQRSAGSATAPVKDAAPRRVPNNPAARRTKADSSAPDALAAPSADAMMSTPGKPLTVAASPTGPATNPAGAPSPTASAPPESGDRPSLGAVAGTHPARTATQEVQVAASPAADVVTAPAVPHAANPAANDGHGPQDGFSVSAGVAPTPPLDASLRPIAAALHRPTDMPVVTAQPGQIGHEVGVEIARRISAGGEQLVVRLDPAELGRIEVHMSFDDSGSLRATIAADSPVALDMLRRDSADLSRSLSDAGVRSDGQSLRFQNDGGGNGNQPRSPWLAADPKSQRAATGSFGDEFEATPYRPVRTSGRYDLLA